LTWRAVTPRIAAIVARALPGPGAGRVPLAEGEVQVITRRWIAVVVGGLLCVSCTGGDDEAVADPTSAPPATSVAEPTTEATPETATESTTEPTPDATTEPTSEPTTDATSEPTTEPTPDATTEPTSASSGEPSTDTATDAGAALAGWERIVPGGECRCADGSEYGFWVRRADPTKVLFFLQGGGACFNAETCDPETGTYKTTTGPEDYPGRRGEAGGIFDPENAFNPFADHTIVYVPYCTGDVHLGDRVTTYSPEVIINHVGAVNAGAALDQMIAEFPAATDVVVAGESAGAIPAPLYAGLIADLLPDADIDVLADGAGAYPDVAGINGLLDSLWGVVDALPDWPETAPLTAETWSFPELFVVAGQHAPEVTMARHDYAFDATQAFFAGLGGVAADDLVSLIDANEVLIEGAGVELLSYIAPGDDHTVLGGDAFYTEEVEGQPFVDWVRQLVADQPVSDVHCTVCGP
jgi:hypothetical protein